MIFWCKGKKKFLQTKRSSSTRSQSCPSHEGAVTKSAKNGSNTEHTRPVNSEEFTLILKTRLRHGKISDDEKDVEYRIEGWTAPEKMADELSLKWQPTVDAELRVYREKQTGNLRFVVNEDKDTHQMSRMYDSVKDTVRDKASAYLPSSAASFFFGSSNTVATNKEGVTLPPNDELDVG